MTANSLQSQDLRAPLWITLIALLSVVFSVAFACATPFAAFAAAAAVTLSRKYAFAMIGAAFFANQFVGYAFLGYPLEMQSFVWGGAIGVAALASTYIAILTNEKLVQKSAALRCASVFAASVITYQILMLAAAFVLDGLAGNTLAIVLRVTAIDAASFALLLTAYIIGKTMDIVPQYNHQ